jgi:hypothetical protein
MTGPCPPWCSAEHDEHPVQVHESDLTAAFSVAGEVFTQARQIEHRGVPEPAFVRAFISTGGSTAGLSLRASDARALAAITENLGATAGHQAFADGLRANAELIDPSPEPEAGQ